MIRKFSIPPRESGSESSGESSLSNPDNPEIRNWYSELPENDREAIRGREEMLLAFPGMSSEDRERISRQLIEAAYLDSQEAGAPPSEILTSIEEEPEEDEPEGGSPPPSPEDYSDTEEPEFDPHALDKLRELREISGEDPPLKEKSRIKLDYPASIQGLRPTLRNYFLEREAYHRRDGKTLEEARTRAEKETLVRAEGAA